MLVPLFAAEPAFTGAEPAFTGTATQVAPPGDKVVVLATNPLVGKPIARSQPIASIDRYVQIVFPLQWTRVTECYCDLLRGID